jgi:1-acyl-sn-glycerol-3-phosphate acyltransferase
MLLRLVRLCLHLFQGLLTCAVIFPWLDMKRRTLRIQRWSTQLVSICGVKVDVRMSEGLRPAGHAMIVANHLSWLDIFVINTIQPCRFVAKSDVRDWPLIGWLCDKAGTIFIARGRVRDVRRIFEHLVAALHDGERVAFFPEGSVAVPGMLQPFHANLFEAAIDAGVPVQPCALQYVDRDGCLHPAANFSGNINFMRSVFMIARARGMIARLTLLPPIPTEGAHRRELANAARQSISIALGNAEPVQT